MPSDPSSLQQYPLASSQVSYIRENNYKILRQYTAYIEIKFELVAFLSPDILPAIRARTWWGWGGCGSIGPLAHKLIGFLTICLEPLGLPWMQTGTGLIIQVIVKPVSIAHRPPIGPGPNILSRDRNSER